MGSAASLKFATASAIVRASSRRPFAASTERKCPSSESSSPPYPSPYTLPLTTQCSKTIRKHLFPSLWKNGTQPLNFSLFHQRSLYLFPVTTLSIFGVKLSFTWVFGIIGMFKEIQCVYFGKYSICCNIIYAMLVWGAAFFQQLLAIWTSIYLSFSFGFRVELIYRN